MKLSKLLVLFSLLSTTVLSASYYISLDDKLSKSVVVAASYNSDGFYKDGTHKDTGTEYDPNGYDINGFNSSGIHKDTGTEYNPEGYDVQGFGEGVCSYNSSNRVYFGWNSKNYFYEEGILIGTKTSDRTLEYNGNKYYSDLTNKTRSGDGYYYSICKKSPKI